MKFKKSIVGVAVLMSASFSQSALACDQDGYIGSICAFGGNFSIRSFAKAEGQLLSISSNTALFSLYGTSFGGDGRTTFGLPDLRGKELLGSDSQGPGLNRIRLGESGGSDTVTLNLSQLAFHNHAGSTSTVTSITDYSESSAILKALSGSANSTAATGSVLANAPRRKEMYANAAPNVDMSVEAIQLDVQLSTTHTAVTSLQNTGLNQTISTKSPYLGVTWLILLNGIYPSRS